MLDKTYRNEEQNIYIVMYRRKKYKRREENRIEGEEELKQLKIKALNNLDARFEAEQQIGNDYKVVSVRKEKNK